jgi:SanA protein
MLKKLINISWKISLSLIIIIFFSYKIIDWTTNNQIKSQVNEVQTKKVGLVLGTSKYVVNGGQNLFFKYRIDATVQLYKQGKINHILVSGDNGHKSYNEPEEMRKELIKHEIPYDKITLDYAGFRTFDSMIRCKEVFCQTDIIIITQRFHLHRSLFLANRFGMKAIGFEAKAVPKAYAIKTTVREYFARVKALLDIYILNTSPKFLGQKECII